MLVCNVSVAARRTVATGIVEVAAASDTINPEGGIFAALVDEPVSAIDFADAYSGEIMVEAATAADDFGASLLVPESIISETANALDAVDFVTVEVATTTYNGTPSAGIVMSNGNLTVTHGTTNANTGVNSLTFLSAGKYYFETTVQVSTSGGTTLGIYQSGAYGSNILGGKGTAVSTGAGSTLIYSNGASTTKNLGVTAVGDVFGFAIDLTNRLAWIRRNNGLWNADATANPVTGVGGVIVAAGSFAPYVSFTNTGATNAFTGNFGQVAYANAAPGGFLFWK
jgi:hypothetical protein